MPEVCPGQQRHELCRLALPAVARMSGSGVVGVSPAGGGCKPVVVARVPADIVACDSGALARLS